MADMTKKAAGYVQVKLIPADRNGQTWSGWSQRWVDLLVVSQDSGQSKRDKIPEVWLEVRKSKSAGKPIKMWTIDAKDTVLYRCTSKRKGHAFAIQFKGKDIVYLSGNSETESHDWMKIVRECLCPTDKIVELEVSAGRLFEASVIDNSYSASCGLFGKYGHLSCRENKLIMFDNNGVNVVQEWYLHTIRKLEAFKASSHDDCRILTIHLGENSSTGCGVIYYYCPEAVGLLKSIQASIKEIFNNIADDQKVQQATLMSLGALHDVTLEETEVKDPLMTLIIADEIIKAKQDLSQSKRLQALKPAIQEATNKDEPFVWKDNEYYDEEAVKTPVKADYTPPEEEPPKKPRRASFQFIRRPRANSSDADPPKPPKAQPRRGSLPQSGRFQPKSPPSQTSENEMALQMQRFQHILNLADQENTEQIFPVVGSPRSHSSVGSGEIAHAINKLSALDECSEETTSLSTSLTSVNLPSLNDEKPTDELDSKNEVFNENVDLNDTHVELGAKNDDSKTDENEDSITEETGDTTIENIDLMNLDANEEPELDLRLREPDDSENDPFTANESGTSGLAGAAETPATNDTLESMEDLIPHSVAQVVAVSETGTEQSLKTNSSLLVETASLDAPDGQPAATIPVTNIDRKGSTHAVKINFGPPPKPKRSSRN